MTRTIPIQRFVFYGGLLCLAGPLWLHAFIPTQDGPLHVYNAYILDELISGHVIKPEMVINTNLNTNWLAQLLLYSFFKLFGYLWAEKIVTSLLLVSMALTVLSVFKRLTTHYYLLAILYLPFLKTILFHMGFYNFLFGQVFFLMHLILWINIFQKKYTNVSIREVILLLCTSTLAFFAHITAGLLIVLFLLCAATHLFIFRSGSKVIQDDVRKRVINIRNRQLCIMGLILTPQLVLIAKYMLPKILSAPVLSYEKSDYLARFLMLVTQKYLASISVEEIICISVAWSIIVLFTMRIVYHWVKSRLFLSQNSEANNSLATFKFVIVFCLMILAILSIIAPLSYMGGQLLELRAMSYALLLIFIIVACHCDRLLSASSIIIYFAIATVLPVIIGISQHHHYGKINQAMVQYNRIGYAIEPGSNLVSVDVAHLDGSTPGRYFPYAFDPLEHFSAYIGMVSKSVKLDNFMAYLNGHTINFKDIEEVGESLGPAFRTPPKHNQYNFSAFGFRYPRYVIYTGKMDYLTNQQLIHEYPILGFLNSNYKEAQSVDDDHFHLLELK